MSDDKGRQIVKYSEQTGSLRDIIDEPIKHLTTQQRQELVGKAAELGLEIQVDAARKKIRHQAGWSDIDQFSKQHIEISRTSGLTSHKILGEFEVASGKVRIEAKAGRCFVATAVYGSEGDQDVIYLRTYRDRVLRKSWVGRRFIAWYCRNGPKLASLLENRQGLKVVVRRMLMCIVAVLRRCT